MLPSFKKKCQCFVKTEDSSNLGVENLVFGESYFAFLKWF
jgi:hypothetical protein